MTPQSANPFVYIFSLVAIAAVLIYYGYGALDHAGLRERNAVATVTGKQFAESGRSYYTTVAGGRTWVQSQVTPETHVVLLSVGNEQTAGVVSKELYESLQAGESVQVRLRRTRMTRRLEVVDVTR